MDAPRPVERPTAERPRVSNRLPWILLAVVLLGMAGYFGRDRIAAALRPAPASAGVGTVSTLTGPGVLRRIQALNRLETVSFKVQTVVTKEQSPTAWGLMQNGQKVLLIVEGTVIAGINLDELRASDIQVADEGKRIAVTLPAAAILSSSVDRADVYDSEAGWFGFANLDPKLVEAARQDGRAQIERVACASDLLTTATKNAKTSMENLLTMTGAEGVVVETTPPAPCAAPALTPVP